MPDSLTSFIDGSSSDNQNPESIKTWMQTVFDNHHDGTKKKQVISYFNKIIQDDENIVRKAQFNVSAARSKIKQLHAEIEHPITHVDDLLTTISLSNAAKNTALLALMQTDNSQVYPGTFEFTETLVINGDNIHVFGDDNGLPARNTSGGLASNTVCTKGITLEGNNITIKGIHFKNTDNTIPFDFHCITFTGNTSNVSFINCIFEGPLYTNAETVWWFGTNFYLEGDVTVKNCSVHNFMNWMLMDANTESSAAGTKALRNVLFTENRITADLESNYPGVGAIAFRGLQSDPGKLAVCTHNTFKFLCHELFWAAIEVNNFEKVYAADNDLIDWSGEDEGPNTKAFFQSWSKAGVFTFQAERNRVRGVRVAYALALGNVGVDPLFYGCTPESYIKITATDLAEDVESLKVDNAVSLIYPWDGNNNPTQFVISGEIPTIVNASGTPVVTTANEWVVSAVTGAPSLPSSDDEKQDDEIDQDLTFGDPPLVESLTVTQSDMYSPSIGPDHVFELGNYAFGYIQINNDVELVAQSVQWFRLKLHSNIVEANPLRTLIEQVILPDGAGWTIINQQRSYADGIVSKRMHLDTGSANVPANSEYFLRLYFRILN